MVICPLCRSEHPLPNNGFFPSDITRVNLLEINSLSITTKPDVDLPPEILEMVFQNFTSTQDVENCSIALAGTRHEEFVTHKFLKLQLNIFASLPSLNVSLKNEGWFKECQDTKLILRLFKEYKPILPSMYHFFSKQLL